ncbi:hypothetical protein HZS_4271 [Henneguya salminicola]|nr:hypothetical protein HZS_4271 [Henneguya salminicola]
MKITGIPEVLKMEKVLQPIDSINFSPQEKYILFNQGERAKISDKFSSNDVVIYLTNLRLLFRYPRPNVYKQLPLHCIDTVTLKSSKMKHMLSYLSPRINSTLRIHAEHDHFDICLDETLKNKMFNVLTEKLKLKEWILVERHPANIQPKRFGIGAIERERDQVHQSNQITISQSFKDITTLMTEVM